MREADLFTGDTRRSEAERALLLFYGTMLESSGSLLRRKWTTPLRDPPTLPIVNGIINRSVSRVQPRMKGVSVGAAVREKMLLNPSRMLRSVADAKKGVRLAF